MSAQDMALGAVVVLLFIIAFNMMNDEDGKSRTHNKDFCAEGTHYNILYGKCFPGKNVLSGPSIQPVKDTPQ